MRKFFAKLRRFWLDLWFEIKSWPGKTRRFAWDRGVKLQWNRLWIRKDEFHSSLDMDINAMFEMSQKQRDAYIKNLYKRQQIAHERDLASN
jgi:hypothetical protein